MSTRASYGIFQSLWRRGDPSHPCHDATHEPIKCWWWNSAYPNGRSFAVRLCLTCRQSRYLANPETGRWIPLPRAYFRTEEVFTKYIHDTPQPDPGL